ncbi:alkaline phosphatase [Thioalkalicoccus limnaeus]|uniref:Alkaline phosphatase n=1 Tax=Thioalkalicoccus limnaeus TaxID=120681 RepID=A0ABV4BBT2_9GAMM
MNRRVFFASLLGFALALVTTLASANPFATGGISAAIGGPSPKYVFFFLGDGMSSSQIQATEAYLTTINGGSARVAEDLLRPENRLNMSKMPVAGMQTTYDSYALMTDSASSATAFAAGIKTQSGTIGKTPDLTRSVKSVAELAHERGMKVGILSSVPLNHATPAAYYASVDSRNAYNDIAVQMVDSGFEFFGGGGILASTGPVDIWDYLTAHGYEVRNDRASIEALKQQPRDKVVAINPVLLGGAMPYAIDKPAENLSLAEMTRVAIANLYQPRGRGANRGFFIMVEGGKIDWSGHANDAMANIGDMLDFDAAVGVALEFYQRHPQETLIIVTGDHETGGMTIGHATTGYTAYYDVLLGQTKSYEAFQNGPWKTHKAAHSEGYDWTRPDNLATTPAMIDLIEEEFGLAWDDLSVFQQERLEDAYDVSMAGQNRYSVRDNRALYGGYEPIVVTLTQIMNERASIGWTSYAHTGVPVPVFAQGRTAGVFSGFYDNTDIAKRLAQVMRLPSLPVYRD